MLLLFAEAGPALRLGAIAGRLRLPESRASRLVSTRRGPRS
jgi:hypothetical protein